MKDALPALLLLIENTKIGHLVGLLEEDAYTQGCVFTHALNSVGLQAEFLEGSLRYHLKAQNNHMMVCCIKLHTPSGELLVGLDGHIGIDAILKARVESVHKINDDPTLSVFLSRLDRASIPVETYLTQESAREEFPAMVDHAVALVQAYMLNEPTHTLSSSPKRRL